MATPKKKYPYNFVYRDGRYVEFHLTREDFDKVILAKVNNENTAIVSIGFIEVKDVVTAVEKIVQNDTKQPIKENINDESTSFSKQFNTPPMDVDSEEYLRRVLANIWEEGDVQ